MHSISEADVVALVHEYADRTHGPEQARAALDATSDLADFGLDSTDLVVLAAEFEDRFGVPVEPVAFLTHDSIRLVLADLERNRVITLVPPSPGLGSIIDG